MKKFIISLFIIASVGLISTVSADSPSRFMNYTGTGMSQTGMNCGSGMGTGIAMDSLANEEAYVNELNRLFAEKKALYQAAMNMSGSEKAEAIKAANEKFRQGHEKALDALKAAMEGAKRDMRCKKPEGRGPRLENNTGSTQMEKRGNGKEKNGMSMQDLRQGGKEIGQMDRGAGRDR